MDKQKICRAAAELVKDCRSVILGVGISAGVLNYLDDGVTVICENGLIGMVPGVGCVDAGRGEVGISPGGAIIDSCAMFGLIRSGRLDAAVISALQVDRAGNIAAHSTGKRLFGYGGAIDIYFGAHQVIAAIQHWKFVDKLTLPITTERAVNIVVTEKGVFYVDPMV